MRQLFLISLVFFSKGIFNAGIAQQSLQPIGQWREHLPYKSTIDVVASNDKIFVATPYSLFTVNRLDNDITRMSRLTGLSETGVSTIGYNTTTNKLLIAYSNSNIDVLWRNDIFNIPALKNTAIVGDKTIHHIYCYNENFYLSTGIGVIVINGVNYEIKDSWFMGVGGNKININECASDSNYFYAATQEGLKAIAITNTFPANYLNWQLISGANGLPASVCSGVLVVKNKVIATARDSLFIKTNNEWTLFFSENNWRIQKVATSGDKIILCQTKSDGTAKVTILNIDGSVFRVLQDANLISKPRKAIFVNDEYWLADSVKGLIKFMAAGFESYQLNSPLSIATGEITIRNNQVIVAAGAVNRNWQKQENKNAIYKFSNGQWLNYATVLNTALDSVQDILSVAIHPIDKSIWAGSYGGGLLHIKNDNSLEIFKQNSSLQAATFDIRSYRVAGLAFDNHNNLWMSNYGAAKNISVRKADGSWKSFSTPFLLNENAAGQLLIDGRNRKWMVSPLGNGLICFDDANTIDNIGDDQWKIYKTGVGNGNLPSNNVYCVAEDKNGFIWIGTDDGIGVVQCSQNIFTAQGCDAINPVVQQNGFNSYLFKGEEVRCIAIDGANRKWVATKKGVWLVSADGEKMLLNFTVDNSSLLSNDVRSIAVDGKTGEVFFATANGICSFRSTATEGFAENENILVFPNPVPPGYSGSIAIRGVANNAVVKIIEMDGRLVFQAQAFGGQVIWNGLDFKGRKISSGIYIVLLSDEDRRAQAVTKIIFISKQ